MYTNLSPAPFSSLFAPLLYTLLSKNLGIQHWCTLVYDGVRVLPKCPLFIALQCDKLMSTNKVVIMSTKITMSRPDSMLSCP